MKTNSPSQSFVFAMTLLAIVMVAYILVIGKNLIIPFIVALLIWQLINTVANGIIKLPWIGEWIPHWICMIASVALLWALASGIVGIITDNIAAVINAAPRYQDKLMQLMNKLPLSSDFKHLSLSSGWIQQLDFKNLALNMYAVVTTLTGNTILIFLYIIFLFFEQKVLPSKLKEFFIHENYRHLVVNMVHYIVRDTQVYLGIKTLTSLLTASLSWLIMWWVGLDFAEFWALLIFFLNFIPSIGAIVATVFPAVLALVQFSGWPPFLVIALGVSGVQFCIGSFLEPRLMGYSLNLSPLVILISLGIWGSLWGVIGMFLSVPITVTMMIVFSHFQKTRGIAVLLSRDGTLKNREL